MCGVRRYISAESSFTSSHCNFWCGAWRSLKKSTWARTPLCAIPTGAESYSADMARAVPLLETLRRPWVAVTFVLWLGQSFVGSTRPAYGYLAAGQSPWRWLSLRTIGCTPTLYVITWITTHLPTPKGWKAELAWHVQRLYKKWVSEYGLTPRATQLKSIRRRQQRLKKIYTQTYTKYETHSVRWLFRRSDDINKFKLQHVDPR